VDDEFTSDSTECRGRRKRGGGGTVSAEPVFDGSDVPAAFDR